MPVVTGYNGSGNGCDTGWSSRLAAYLALTLQLPNFSGNVDAPIQGASFLGACNNHDPCFGTQMGFAECNAAFTTDLNAACQSANSIASCNIAVAQYSTTVTGTSGIGPYSSSGELRTCFICHREIQANRCTIK